MLTSSFTTETVRFQRYYIILFPYVKILITERKKKKGKSSISTNRRALNQMLWY